MDWTSEIFSFQNVCQGLNLSFWWIHVWNTISEQHNGWISALVISHLNDAQSFAKSTIYVSGASRLNSLNERQGHRLPIFVHVLKSEQDISFAVKNDDRESVLWSQSFNDSLD